MPRNRLLQTALPCPTGVRCPDDTRRRPHANAPGKRKRRRCTHEKRMSYARNATVSIAAYVCMMGNLMGELASVPARSRCPDWRRRACDAAKRAETIPPFLHVPGDFLAARREFGNSWRSRDAAQASPWPSLSRPSPSPRGEPSRLADDYSRRLALSPNFFAIMVFNMFVEHRAAVHMFFLLAGVEWTATRAKLCKCRRPRM